MNTLKEQHEWAKQQDWYELLICDMITYANSNNYIYTIINSFIWSDGSNSNLWATQNSKILTLAESEQIPTLAFIQQEFPKDKYPEYYV